MKITNITTFLITPRQSYLFVIVHTDEGIEGYGEASLNGQEAIVANYIDNYLKQLLIGLNPENIEDIWQLLYRSTYWKGGAIAMSAISAIDIALWDIVSKKRNTPLYNLLGGKCRDKILCYRHIMGNNLSEKICNAKKLVHEEGFKVVRIRAGLPAAANTFNNSNRKQLIETWNPEKEIERTIELFYAISDAVGNDSKIILDLHQRFSALQAIQIINEIKKANLLFIEDPVPPDNINELRLVREKTEVNLAFGELLTDRHQYIRIMEENLIDYIRMDVIRIGGISEARKICALAEYKKIKTAWHGPNDVSPLTHAVNWHLNISFTNFGIQEYGIINTDISNVISGGPFYKNGYLYMNEVNGHGCQLFTDNINRYPYIQSYLPICRKDDGTLTDW